MRRIIESVGTLLRRRAPASYVSRVESSFWRLPESIPAKRRLIEAEWGKDVVPTILTYDMTPLQSLGFDDTLQIAVLFFGKEQYPSGSIQYRLSRSEPPTTLLVVKHPKVFHAEIELRGHRLPLMRAAYRAPGRSGQLLCFNGMALPVS